MRIYNGIDVFPGTHSACLTTGTFDGVHVGHKKILNILTSTAAQKELESVLLTFYPHPRKVLFPEDHGLKLINTLNEKLELLELEGIDHVIVQPFSAEFSRHDPVQYIRDILVNKINAKHIVIGYDHRFGRNREGGIDDLKEMSSVYDFGITEIGAEDINNVKVSSTKIRNALLTNDFSTAATYLGYDYFISGVVVEGDKRGRELGFPKANIEIDDDTKLIPNQGVFAVRVQLGTNQLNGMMNIGTNPTFSNSGKRTIEVHIFNFENDIYNNEIKVSIYQRLRDEQKFKTAEELVEQMNRDKIDAINLLQ